MNIRLILGNLQSKLLPQKGQNLSRFYTPIQGVREKNCSLMDPITCFLEHPDIICLKKLYRKFSRLFFFYQGYAIKTTFSQDGTGQKHRNMI